LDSFWTDTEDYQTNTPYVWLCELDITKGIYIGETYLNSKAAMKFGYAIAQSERKKNYHKVKGALSAKIVNFCYP
jgi:hypothetical protein